MTGQITGWPMATAIAECYKRLAFINPALKKLNALKVLYACFQVPYFDPDRLVSGAEKKAGEITSITKIDLFFTLFEDLYNFNRKEKKPLEFDARTAMHNKRLIKSKK